MYVTSRMIDICNRKTGIQLFLVLCIISSTISYGESVSNSLFLGYSTWVYDSVAMLKLEHTKDLCFWFVTLVENTFYIPHAYLYDLILYNPCKEKDVHLS